MSKPSERYMNLKEKCHWSTYFVLSKKQSPNIVITAHQQSCGKVMFSVISVCPSFCQWGVPCDHYPWCIRAHHRNSLARYFTGLWISLYRPSGHGTALYRDPPAHPELMTSGGQDWRSVQTCSSEDSYWCWHLVATEGLTVGKRALGILLERFLIVRGFFNLNNQWNI